MNIEQWPIAKIKPYANNPRKNDSAVDKVAMSLKEYGWQQPIVVDGKGVIIVGHTRWKAAKKLNMDTCPVLVAEGLSTAQVKAYRIADNKTNEFAAWDDELLKLEIQDLVDLDFDIELTGFDVGELFSDDRYTKKIESPIYEPKNGKPQIDDLYNLDKYNKLCSEIENADIAEDEKAFLRIAAQRHIVFNYRNIADYYAHSDKEVQELMENSALVIIDFEKAIELGYVRLSEEIANQYKEDYEK